MRMSFTYLTTVTLLFVATNLKAQNYAMSMPGSAAYVDCGSNSALYATNIKTMECWVKFNSFADAEILSRSITNSGVELLVFGGNLAFFCMKNSSNVAYVTYPTSNMSVGVWYHIAAVWDGTKESMAIYVNGIKVSGTVNVVGDINTGITNPTGTFRIGTWSDIAGGRFLNGTVDEVRVWSIARAQSDIKAGMYGTVSTSSTGLIAYFNFNEASGVVLNLLGNTLLNGALVGLVSRVSSPIIYAENALSLDGVDDEIDAPAISAYDLTTGTIQIWAKPTSLSAAHQTLIGVRGSGGTRFSFHVSNTQIGFYAGGSYLTLNYTLTNNTLYQFTFVLNPTTVDVYVNGTLAGTITGNPSSVTGQPLRIGGTGAAGEYFTGVLDEVRLWNYAMTASQVSLTWKATVTGSESSLVAWYPFNQGVSAGANAGLSIAIDGSVSSNNASLANFSLSGSTSNFITSGVTLPVNFSYFKGSRSDASVLLSWQTAEEQNSSYFVIERSGDNLQFQDLGRLQAAGNAQHASDYQYTDASPLTGGNYYRIREVDLDGQAMYSPTVHIDMSSSAAAGLRVYPNPVRASLNFVLGGQAAGGGFIQVSDLSGRTVISRNVQWSAGSNSMSVDLGNLSPGNYVLRVMQAGGGASVAPFQVVR